MIEPEMIRLSNGIPVILQDYEAPVAATYWWVRVGSADEAGEEAGFAHFLEHMLFKDAAAKETGVASSGQMARAIESLGGDINAYTSFDQTVYHVTCAAHHWEKVLGVFSRIAAPQRFLKADFEREREVIFEELRKNQDSPGRQLFQGLFSASFGRHPYGRPVIGFEKTLKSATLARLESFYRRHYIPANMGLILVGPLGGTRRKTLLKMLETRFGKTVLKPRKESRITRVKAPGEKEAEAVSKGFSVSTPSFAISFRTPDLKHEDIPALDLLSGVLSMGELSRLYQRLFYAESLVTDVSGGMFIPSDTGILYFQAELDSVAGIEKVSRGILEEIARIGREGPTDEELRRVIVNAESERLYSTQTADGQAGRIGFLSFVLGDLRYDEQYLARLRQVDRAKIQEVARKYLVEKRMAVSAMVPKEEKFDPDMIVLQARKILGSVGEKASVSKGKVLRGAGSLREASLITTPRGIRVIYHEKPSSHVMSIHAAALGGTRMELTRPIHRKETDWGSSFLMSLTWDKGTRSRDARQIASIVEGKAAGLDGFSGRNTVGLQMTGLARDWRDLSSLFNEVLIEPSFPADEVEHSRRIAEDSVKGIEDHSSQLCSKIFLETLYDKHPYGHLTYGSSESIQKIDTEKLAAFHREWLRPERLVLSVVGAVKQADLDSWVSDLDARFEALTGARGAPMTSPEEEAEPKAPRWVERNLGREQLHIMVGGLGVRVTDEDRFAMRLLQTLLGGQSGRLFVELREEKSLAYTVSPLGFEGIERGYTGTYIACAPQKRAEAIEGIQKVLEKLAAKGPTAKEVVRAKEFYLGRRAMDLQSDSSLAAHYGLEAVYGIPVLTERQTHQKIQTVTARKIQDVCAKYLVEPSMVTAVVG